MLKQLFSKIFGKAISEESSLTIEQIRDLLIQADFGVKFTDSFVKYLKSNHKVLSMNNLELSLKDFIKLESYENFSLTKDSLNIVLFVGVNGVGKTTSVAKLAKYFQRDGFRVLVAAADTFRAAAVEQLKVWSQRVPFDLIEGESKPSTVVYKALEASKTKNYNLLLIDTAGRLHNKQDLMDELAKIQSVIEKNHDDYNLQVLLVLDSTTGQNALIQAQKFKEACSVNSIFLTKYDGTSRAGVIASLLSVEKLPVSFVGLGEGIDDIQVFDLDNFISKVVS